MASAKPVIHGRDHNFGGSDPIPDLGLAIRFDFLNGNTADHWLNVLTTEPTPPGGVEGIAFTDSGGAGIKFYAQGASNNLEAKADGDLILSGAEGVSVTSSGDDIDIDADLALTLTAGANLTATITGNTTLTTTGTISLSSTGDALFESVTGQAQIGFASGHSFTVETAAVSPAECLRVDSSGHVFLRHLPTSDPGTLDGALWNSLGVVKISA